MSLNKVLVRPDYPIAPGIEKLTPLDQFTVRMYMPLSCLFQIDSPAIRPSILRNLQAGLASTIEDVNFLAGTIVRESPENDYIQLKYDEGSGVWLYHQTMDEINYQELVDSRFLFSDEFADRFVPKPHIHLEPCPVMAVQATFINGGLVLTISLHHSLVDAQGAATIIELWSKHTVAESEGRVLPDSERPSRECMDSYSLSWGSTHIPRSDFQPYFPQPFRGYEASQDKIMKAALAGHREELRDMVKLSHWSLSAEAIEELKRIAVPKSVDLPTVTENAILSAFIWHRVSLARQLSENQVSSSSLFTTVNLRRRMDPPLPAGFLRNAVVLAKATAEMAQLEVSLSDAIYHLARSIGDGIDWWTSERIWDFTSSIESWPTTNAQAFPSMDQDLFVTIPSRLGDLIWKSAWGRELGQVKELRSAAVGYFDGIALVLPTARGGQDIMLWTTEDALKRLQDDSEWTRWAEFLG
ncbi:hypothetical protein FQN49_004335 [Arthroderma sp. PD_2]|nr:hypothetical protein FQN49_004335 [Arthroderma sp. PD_2]